ncbi:hypothetical protein RHSA111115_14725 [Rheinheimera salexigens]
MSPLGWVYGVLVWLNRTVNTLKFRFKFLVLNEYYFGAIPVLVLNTRLESER